MKLQVFATASVLYFYHPLWFALLLMFVLFYYWQWRRTHQNELQLAPQDSYFPGCKGMHKEHRSRKLSLIKVTY